MRRPLNASLCVPREWEAGAQWVLIGGLALSCDMGREEAVAACHVQPASHQPQRSTYGLHSSPLRAEPFPATAGEPWGSTTTAASALSRRGICGERRRPYSTRRSSSRPGRATTHPGLHGSLSTQRRHPAPCPEAAVRACRHVRGAGRQARDARVNANLELSRFFANHPKLRRQKLPSY